MERGKGQQERRRHPRFAVAARPTPALSLCNPHSIRLRALEEAARICDEAAEMVENFNHNAIAQRRFMAELIRVRIKEAGGSA